MIGSPPPRRGGAPPGGAGRACLAAALARNHAIAAIAASVTIAGVPQRRVAAVDRAVVNRFAMPCPGWKLASIKCRMTILLAILLRILGLTSRGNLPRR